MFITTIAKAQTDNLSEVLSRLQQLEETVKQQSLQITKLTSDVNEVTKQNLALKKNLNLQPTIAKSIEDNVMEYRILEVSGNTSTREAKITMTADNIGAKDLDLLVNKIQIVDELGAGYDKMEQNNISVPGASDNLRAHAVNFHPKAPYTLTLDINDFNPEAQYIKYLEIKMFNVRDSYKVVFENLPIKWSGND